MNLSSNFALFKITFIIVGIYVKLGKGNRPMSLWLQDIGSSGIMCPNDAMRGNQVAGLSSCAHLCTNEVDCASFTFVDNKASNCYLMTVDPSLLMNCSIELNAQHFLRVYSSFNCQANDSNYDTYKLSDGSYFSYRIVHVRTDAVTARADCETSGGSLLKVSTIARMEFIQDYFTSCAEYIGQHYIIDGNNVNMNEDWTWEDGEPIIMNITFWAPGQPDWYINQHCVSMNSHMSWRFHDIYCENLYYYVCEKEVGL